MTFPITATRFCPWTWAVTRSLGSSAETAALRFASAMPVMTALGYVQLAEAWAFAEHLPLQLAFALHMGGVT